MKKEERSPPFFFVQLVTDEVCQVTDSGNMNTEHKQKIEEILQPLLEDDKFFIVDIKVSLSRLNSKVTVF